MYGQLIIAIYFFRLIQATWAHSAWPSLRE